MNAISDGIIAADFAQRAPTLPGSGLPWLATVRRRAFERFAAAGFPTPANEGWKYTNLAPLVSAALPVASPGPLAHLDAAELLADLGEGHRLVFVNGHYAPDLSAPGVLPTGLTAINLAEALARYAKLIEPHFGTPEDGTPMAALNAALATDGAFIHLARGAIVEQPLHLVFLADAAGTANHPRILIVAEEGAQASVVEHYVGRGDASYWTNSVTRISLAPNARIRHYKVQEEGLQAFHLADISAAQLAGSYFESHSFSLGGRLTRNDIATRFAGEGCETLFNGLYIAVGRQHVDHHTRIDHAQPHGTSREFYRGIVDEAARGIFTGRILVREGARKSDAQQRSDTLLLSPQAEADARPQLEIYADDVKCAHGATIGQLDETALFYLRTRGIDAELGRAMLTHAFGHQVIERIGIPALRARLEQALLARLPAGERVQENA
ncbi:MAG: Fe-S cluster assembly protein SufD [Betaproteobacteria bacterium]